MNDAIAQLQRDIAEPQVSVVSLLQNGSAGWREPGLYTLSKDFVRQHHNATSNWQKVRHGSLQAEIEAFRKEGGFELIAQTLGNPRPTKVRKTA